MDVAGQAVISSAQTSEVRCAIPRQNPKKDFVSKLIRGHLVMSVHTNELPVVVGTRTLLLLSARRKGFVEQVCHSADGAGNVAQFDIICLVQGRIIQDLGVHSLNCWACLVQEPHRIWVCLVQNS